jgi:ABC-type dipeptide/oligopeptide/nickel transport system permease component
MRKLLFGNHINTFVVFFLNMFLNILLVERRSVQDVKAEGVEEFSDTADPVQRYKALNRVSSTLLLITFFILCAVAMSIPIGSTFFQVTKTIADLKAVILLGVPTLFVVMVLQLRVSRAERYSKDWVRAGSPETEKANPSMYFTNLDYITAVLVSAGLSALVFNLL